MVAVAPGRHVQLLAAKLGPGREVAGGPEGARLAAVAGQLRLTGLGRGWQAQTVSVFLCSALHTSTKESYNIFDAGGR